MAIANGTCVMQFLQSAKGTLWPPWVRPWDSCGKYHMDEKRILFLSNASQHVPIYLQPFPIVIQPVSSKVRHFSTFGLPWVRPWDNRGKCYMDVQYVSVCIGDDRGVAWSQ